MAELSPKKNILSQYLEWQFFNAPGDILKAWKNFLIFNLNYFSLPTLLKTFFSPWRRYQASYGRGLNLQRWAETFTLNMMSRIIGAFLRTFFIIIGAIAEILVFIGGLIVFLCWLLLPLILVLIFLYGFKLLF